MRSESLKRAQKKYRETHREHVRYASARSSARSFIRKYATNEDLTMIENMIAEKRANNRR